MKKPTKIAVSLVLAAIMVVLAAGTVLAADGNPLNGKGNMKGNLGVDCPYGECSSEDCEAHQYNYNFAPKYGQQEEPAPSPHRSRFGMAE